MFYEAVKRGLAAKETSISHDEAMRIISGGLIQFLCDFKYSGDMERCERQLFCLAKATNALMEEDRKEYISLLGLLSSTDPYSRDCKFLSDKIAKTMGIDSQELYRAVEDIRELQYAII